MTLTDMLDALRGATTLTVSENERAIALIDGRFHDILGPGRHTLPARGERLTIERHDISARATLVSGYTDALLKARPDLAARHLTDAKAGDHEVLVVVNEGKPVMTLSRGERMVFWTDAGPWEIERYDLSQALDAPRAMVDRVTNAGMRARVAGFIAFHAVAPGHIGLLYVDSVFERELTPGAYAFYGAGRKLDVKLIDTRWSVMEVSGQELLTRDRVTIRVNVSVAYRVNDAQRAVAEADDFSAILYREVQHAFRKALGALTLDAILEKKTGIDAEAAEPVRARLAELGVEIGDITLKDVILPGEMREILNRVVAAEKEAEANVIRRREETAATRALLNTAKVMAENPVMLRLKELEALETISGRVGSLVIHNGPKGLLEDVVRLSEG